MHSNIYAYGRYMYTIRAQPVDMFNGKMC